MNFVVLVAVQAGSMLNFVCVATKRPRTVSTESSWDMKAARVDAKPNSISWLVMASSYTLFLLANCRVVG